MTPCGHHVTKSDLLLAASLQVVFSGGGRGGRGRGPEGVLHATASRRSLTLTLGCLWRMMNHTLCGSGNRCVVGVSVKVM